MNDDFSDWGDYEATAPAATGNVATNPFADWGDPEAEAQKKQEAAKGMSWTDVPASIGADVAGFAAANLTAGQLAAEKSNHPTIAKAAQAGSNLLHQGEDWLRDQETEAFKRSQGAAAFTEGDQEQLGENPLRQLVAKGSGIVVPGAVAGVGAMAGGYGAVPALAWYGYTQDLDKAIAWTNQVNDQELEKSAPVFAQLRKMHVEDNIAAGMPRQEAEDKASYDARVDLHSALYTGSQALLSAGSNAIMGVGVNKMLKGSVNTKGLVDLALGSLETGTGMGAASAASNYSEQSADIAAKGEGELDTGKMLKSFLNGEVEGILFHAGHAGASSGIRRLADRFKAQETATPEVAEKQAVGTTDNAAPSTGAAPKTARATTQPPPNEAAQEGEIGNVVNPPTRDQGVAGAAAKATSKRRSSKKAAVEGGVTVLDDKGPAPDEATALNQSTPGDQTVTQLVEPKPPVEVPTSPVPQVTPEVTRAAEVPEAAPTIDVQIDDLTNKRRNVMRFENADQVPDEVPKGVKEFEAADGSVWWYRGKVSKPKILDAIKNGTENDLLGLGPFNKEAVAADVAAGGEPAAVVARTPDGVEAAAAATTDRLAPETIDAVQEANPGKAVTVEQPQGVIDGREAGTGESALFDEALARREVEDQLRNAQPKVDAEGRRILPPSLTEENIRAGVETRRKEWEIEQEKAAAEDRRAARDLAEAEAEEKENAPPAPPAEYKSKKNPGRDRKRTENRSNADVLFEEHKEGMATNGRAAIIARANTILEAAKERGITIPQELDYAKHSAGQAFLKELQVLVRKARAANKTKMKFPSADDFHRLSQAEFDLRDGLEGYDRYKKNARAEGDAKYGVKFNEAKKTDDHIDYDPKNDEFTDDDREHEAQATTISDAVVDRPDVEDYHQEPTTQERAKVALKGDEITAGTNKAGTFKQDKRPAARSKLSPEERAKAVSALRGLKKSGSTSEVAETNRYPYPEPASSDKPNIVNAKRDVVDYMNGDISKNELITKLANRNLLEGEVWAVTNRVKDFVNSDVEKVLARPEGRPMLDDALREELLSSMNMTDDRVTGEREGHVSTDYGPDAKSAKIIRTETAGDILRNLKAPDAATLGGKLFPLIRMRLSHLVGNVKVHYVDAADLARMSGKDGVRGYYKVRWQGEGGYILLAHDIPQERMTHILTHEALHAATEEALHRNPKLKAEIKSIMEEAKAAMPDDLNEYGFINPSEFLAEAFSNPKFQEKLAGVQVSDRLAKQLGLERRSLWSAIVDRIREALRMPVGTYSALEALVRPVNEAMTENARWRETLMGDKPEGRASIEDVTRRVKNARINSETWLRRRMNGLKTNTMIAMSARRMGDYFSKLTRQVDNQYKYMVVERNELLRNEGGERIARELDAAAKKNPDAMDEGSWLANRAAELQIGIGKGDVNDHIRKVKDPSRGGQWWQAQAEEAGLKKQWSDFEKAHPETAKVIEEAAKWGQEAHEKATREVLTALLRRAKVYSPNLVTNILKEGKVPDADKAVFKSDTLVAHIDRFVGAEGRKGWYLPAMRSGEFVVTAKRDFDVPTSPHVRKITDNGQTNVIQFTDPSGGSSELKARRAAKDYVLNHTASKVDGEADRLNMVGRPEKVWVDKNDTSKLLDQSDVNSIPAYRVRLQDEYMTKHKTQADALEEIEAAKAAGWSNVSQVKMQRKNPNARWGGMMPSQYEELLNSFRDRDTFKGMTPSQQAEAILALHHANVKLLPGDRLQHHRLQRKNVAGYSRELPTVFRDYAMMSAGFRSRVRNMGDIEATLGEMRSELEKYDDKLNVQRMDVYHALEDRIYNGQEFDKTPGIINTLSKMSMVSKLFGPSQPIINATEVGLNTLPVLAGYHGVGRATRALADAYRSIGARSVFMAGGRDFFRAAAKDHGFTDYTQFIKDNIDGAGLDSNRATRLKQVIDHIHSLNLFGHEAGMEMQRLGQADSAIPGLDKVDLMFRQVNQGIEAINRSVTAIAAYDLRYEKNGRNHVDAMQYAHDVVHDTMGDYSAANAAPIFNSNVGKLALQFKKYAQKSYGLMGKLFADAYAGDKEARRAFIGVMLTHGVAAGALGMPGMEIIKAALLVPGVLGGYSYQDFEAAIRDGASYVFGPKLGEAITRGMPRLANVDLSSRVSWDSLALPRDNPSSWKDIPKWGFDMFAGAPGSLPVETIRALTDLSRGDMNQFMQHQPSKFARDIYNAGHGFVAGKQDKNGRDVSQPYSTSEMITNALGFKPGRIANEQERAARGNRETHERQGEKHTLTNNWLNATTPEGKDKARQAITEYNKTVQPDARITPKYLLQQQKSRATEKRKGTYDRGLRVNKGNRDIVQHLDEVYGARQ